jgi:DNA-binding GntR family transcriptional regulator
MIIDNRQEDNRVSGNTYRLESVERASLTEQVLQELRDAIVEGRIPQGEQLREISLAEALGTGRSAVREAIRQLLQEGLVEAKANRGAFVRVLSLADRLDVYVAREAIETGAARRILESEAAVDFARLRAALEELRRAAHDHDHVTVEVIGADIRFHEELVRLAGSPRLSRAHETLVAETRMLLSRHPPYPWKDYVTDHVRLLEALAEGDPSAPDLVAEHLRLSARLIAEELSRASHDGADARGDTPRPGEEEENAST